MVNITHGVSAAKKSTSISTPVVAASGIHFVVGTAPVHTVGGKVNEVVMALSYAEAVEQLGYSDDWEKYSLCEEMYSAFKLYGASPVFFVNVLDPATDKTAVAVASMTPESNQIKLPFEAIASSIVITVGSGAEATTLVKGTDYEVMYDEGSCVVEFTTVRSGAVNVAYDKVNTAAVTKNDIIGGYNAATGKNTGLELIETVFPRFSYVPDLILCPGFSHESEVAAAMSAKAESINGVFEAIALIDVDTSESTGALVYSAVPAWKSAKNVTKANQVLCYPMLKLGDRLFHFSVQLAGSMSAVDNNEDYGGGTPCESASNKSLQADSAVLADGTEIVLDLLKANYLNDNGIVTALNFSNGFVSWGNYTACYPSNTDVADYFYCINRMFRWVSKNLILSFWNSVDRKLNRVVIDAILQGVNTWLNALTAEGRILGGSIVMNADENPETAIMAGKVKFHIYITPPSPLQKIDFVLEYDVSYLETALS